MIEQQFVSFQKRMLKGVPAEQQTTVAWRHSESSQSDNQGILQPHLGDIL